MNLLTPGFIRRTATPLPLRGASDTDIGGGRRHHGNGILPGGNPDDVDLRGDPARAVTDRSARVFPLTRNSRTWGRRRHAHHERTVGDARRPRRRPSTTQFFLASPRDGAYTECGLMYRPGTVVARPQGAAGDNIGFCRDPVSAHASMDAASPGPAAPARTGQMSGVAVHPEESSMKRTTKRRVRKAVRRRAAKKAVAKRVVRKAVRKRAVKKAVRKRVAKKAVRRRVAKRAIRKRVVKKAVARRALKKALVKRALVRKALVKKALSGGKPPAWTPPGGPLGGL
jgi:hypothetical protein